MAAATFDLRPIVSKKEWAIQGKLDIGVNCEIVVFFGQNLYFLEIVGQLKPCQEDWVDLSSPGNTSSDAPTISLSHQEEKCEREIGQVEEGRMRRREFFDLSPQSGKLQKSLATTLLVSKLVDAMVGLVLVLVETIAWLVAWRTNQSSPSSVPIFLLLPTPLSSFLWLATRYRTKNPGQVVWIHSLLAIMIILLAGTWILLHCLAPSDKPPLPHNHVKPCSLTNSRQ